MGSIVRKRPKSLLLALAAALTLGLSALALAASVTCTGGPCSGTAADDTITGSSLADQIDASQGGDDTISAGLGNDTVDLSALESAGAGEDSVDGGDGDDTITAGEDHDFDIDGDLLEGSIGNDTLTSLDAHDGATLRGGAGADQLNAADVADPAFQEGSEPPGTNYDFEPDVLDGGPGVDVCTGGRTDTYVDCETIIDAVTAWEFGDIITHPQGSWGEVPTGTSAAKILADNFATVYPEFFVEVGIPGASGFSMIFQGATAVHNYLPTLGAPAALNADLSDPTSSASGSFGGEVLALQLNVDFSDAGVTLGALGIPFGDLELCNFTDLPLLNGLSVRGFLGVVNSALGGDPPLYPIAQLAVVTDDLNHAFDNGAVTFFASEHVCLPPAPPDAIPPETTIASGPEGLTNQTSPTFTFFADEPATFECRIDAGTFAPCDSGDSFGPLANGSHTFFVRATDLADNVDETPAERTFEVRACTISGNNNANSLSGTSGNDVLCGFGGNDTISPSLGHDIVFGGTGNDYVSPGFGNDRLLGQDDNDSVNGGPGNDQLDGGAGTDSCNGGFGTDTAVGCEGGSGVP